MATERAPLYDGSFFESFLIDVEIEDWPNVYIFSVWSSQDALCYRITTSPVLEFHIKRTGTGTLEDPGEGIPLLNIYTSTGEDFDYWTERIAIFRKEGFDSGSPPICLEFASHLFTNRKGQDLVRDRSTGILVVCRKVTIEEDYRYDGPRPFPYRIPASD